MYQGVPTQQSCARAWVAACIRDHADRRRGLQRRDRRGRPVNHDEKDNDVITLVDKFLKAHDENPIITVANTIFPQSLYWRMVRRLLHRHIGTSTTSPKQNVGGDTSSE